MRASVQYALASRFLAMESSWIVVDKLKSLLQNSLRSSYLRKRKDTAMDLLSVE